MLLRSNIFFENNNINQAPIQYKYKLKNDYVYINKAYPDH